MEGKLALKYQSPANPALHIPDPLSITKAFTSLSPIMIVFSAKFPLIFTINGIVKFCVSLNTVRLDVTLYVNSALNLPVWTF